MEAVILFLVIYIFLKISGTFDETGANDHSLYTENKKKYFKKLDKLYGSK